MIYKNFRFSILFRVIIIAGLSLSLAFVLLRQEMFFVPLGIALLLIAAVISLIRHIEKANKDLTHFLLSIRQGAFTESYTSGNRGKPYAALSDAMNEIVREFAKINTEKELHYQYLEALNENINVAILSFDSDGTLMMMNPAAKRLIHQPTFSHLEHFRNIDPTLYQTVKQILPEEKAVILIFIGEEQYHVSVQVKEIMLLEKRVRIVLIQNLNNELEAKEIEAWGQLMRVLTHEIMNSVTPIFSLTGAIQGILSNPDGTRKDLSTLTEENTEDIYSSLATIASRSKGLLKFINAYKEYSKPIGLHLEEADVTALVNRVVDLLNPDVEKFGIRLRKSYTTRQILAKTDIALMENVLINLIKNGIEAVPHDGTGVINIELKTKANGRVSILVSDNGSGIEPETLPKIFIPFFTTKSNGSGIGLSLSRQIMKLHNGSIRANSSPDTGASFIIEWR